MGRNKISDKIKVLRGTDQPCRKSNVDFEFISKLPKAPDYFSKTGKLIYKNIGKNLLAGKVLTQSNLPQFIAYCIEISVYLDANENMNTLAKRIEKLSSANGSRTFVSGTQRVAALALQNALKLGKEFGFTPATVGRIAMVAKKEHDSFSEFMNS